MCKSELRQGLLSVDSYLTKTSCFLQKYWDKFNKLLYNYKLNLFAGKIPCWIEQSNNFCEKVKKRIKNTRQKWNFCLATIFIFKGRKEREKERKKTKKVVQSSVFILHSIPPSFLWLVSLSLMQNCKKIYFIAKQRKYSNLPSSSKYETQFGNKQKEYYKCHFQNTQVRCFQIFK